MDLCISILSKLFVMSLIMILGYLSRIILKIDRNTIALILFYILAPILFFTSVAKMRFALDSLLLPFIISATSGVVCFFIYKAKFLYKDNKIRSFLAFSAPNGNVGYFLLPVTWVLFDEAVVGMYVLIIVGNIIYENTIGFYIASRGNYSAQESLKKLVRLPAMYAFILGVAFSAFSIKIPCMFDDLTSQVKGAYSLFGMMIVGVALSEVKWKEIDFQFLYISFLGKYILWPIVILTFIILDKNLLHLYDSQIYKLFILTSTAPLAANNIVIGSVVGGCPTRAGSAVLFSTIFSIFYVPFIIYFL